MYYIYIYKVYFPNGKTTTWGIDSEHISYFWGFLKQIQATLGVCYPVVIGVPPIRSG